MSRLRYPAIIEYIAEDENFTVEFPDLKGCITHGDTIKAAKAYAKDAMSAFLASMFDRGFKIPEPSDIKGDNVYLIEPEPYASVPILLRKLRQEFGYSQVDVAKKLGIPYQVYQKLENPNKCNPTVKTLEKIANIYNKHLHLEIA
ncbi:MAG: type II toxin-antitoxin system HicB family antitoxin [Nitrospirae bacterium]|uniref:type II toxin-antitoxin system HicB family antitoxin n=1 Tax=Candidatus Magnetobacterium casense TaxID=1455061 RepID=UPI0005916BDA|nr:type II toxin-antitoxin system HicB family antitoxin [Candidatus Magnetobacterium casensis]MBF0337515.1 type II toxin-antitoxin system HicB family antitoxin [Nitrospirota bacterium]